MQKDNSLEDLHQILKQIEARVERHQKKWFSGWRTQDFTKEINELRLKKKILDNRFKILQQIAKIFQIPVTTTLMGKSSYNENDYSILDETNIIKENLIGTNGVNYRHNYFLAIIHKNEINNNKENKEIGALKFMSLDDCLKVIRPYHNNKQIIIKKIHSLILNFMIEYSDKIEELCIN